MKYIKHIFENDRWEDEKIYAEHRILTVIKNAIPILMDQIKIGIPGEGNFRFPDQMILYTDNNTIGVFSIDTQTTAYNTYKYESVESDSGGEEKIANGTLATAIEIPLFSRDKLFKKIHKDEDTSNKTEVDEYINILKKKGFDTMITENGYSYVISVRYKVSDIINISPNVMKKINENNNEYKIEGNNKEIIDIVQGAIPVIVKNIIKLLNKNRFVQYQFQTFKLSDATSEYGYFKDDGDGNWKFKSVYKTEYFNELNIKQEDLALYSDIRIIDDDNKTPFGQSHKKALQSRVKTLGNDLEKNGFITDHDFTYLSEQELKKSFLIPPEFRKNKNRSNVRFFICYRLEDLFKRNDNVFKKINQ